MGISKTKFVLSCSLFLFACNGELTEDNNGATNIDLGEDQTIVIIGEDMGGDNDFGSQSDLSMKDPDMTTEDVRVDPCEALNCSENEICDASTATCLCREGYVDSGNDCVLAAPGDPATRSKAEMCERWNAGITPQASSTWESDGQDCGPGILPQDAIDDTVRRINAYRWLSGLANVTDNPAVHDAQMECAAMMSKQGALSHSPGPDYACYTEAGAGSAGSSNIAYGYGSSADAIDGYMDDGQVPSLGHRRWILNGPLGRVGIGFSKAGNRPGQCLSVFDRSGMTTRDWTSFPNHGITPIRVAGYIWSFQHYGGAIGQNTSATVLRLSDNQSMPVMTEVLGGGGLPSTLKILRENWSPEVDESYRVTITNLNGTDLTYEISPVNC